MLNNSVKVNNKKIKLLRKNLEYSQQALSNKIGISYNAITKIEQGLAKQPTVQVMKLIADGLECSIEDLLIRN